MTSGCASRNPRSWEPGMTRQRSVVFATMSLVGDSPSRTETSPKNSPRCEARSLLPVQDEAGLSLEDHVDVRAGEALPQDSLARGDDFLVEGVRDLLELGPAEIGEEAQPREGRG